MNSKDNIELNLASMNILCSSKLKFRLLESPSAQLLACLVLVVVVSIATDQFGRQIEEELEGEIYWSFVQPGS